jgi:hypothetical protein
MGQLDSNMQSPTEAKELALKDRRWRNGALRLAHDEFAVK